MRAVKAVKAVSERIETIFAEAEAEAGADAEAGPRCDERVPAIEHLRAYAA
ncbi:hypothetical protein ACWGH2_34290 [Streptomyces sp. NPDC054871]